MTSDEERDGEKMTQRDNSCDEIKVHEEEFTEINACTSIEEKAPQMQDIEEQAAEQLVRLEAYQKENQALKKEVGQLSKLNDELKKEVADSQREIGEVLLTAKRQANRTLEMAQDEANQMIHSAKLQLEQLNSKAHESLIEIGQSKQAVAMMYGDLQEQVRKLAGESIRIEVQPMEMSET